MAFKQTPGYLADAFQNAFRQRIEQQQQEREFNQKLAEDQRQSSLIEYWRQKNFEADESYRRSQLENQRIDNELAAKTAENNFLDKMVDNQRQLDKDEYQKGQDAKRLSIDQTRLGLEKERLKTQQQGGIWKGFGDYAVKKSKLLQQTVPTPEIDGKGNKTGNWIDTSKTPGEIKQGLLELRGHAVSKLPPVAQSFYVSNFLDKKASKLAFHSYVKKAFLDGQLSENDANALLDFNELRSDWGEIPQGERTKITRQK